MTVSRYFSHNDNSGELDLFEDLVIEEIQLNGIDIWYFPRKDLVLDKIFGEPDATIFDSGFKIEAMAPNLGDDEGQDIMSKFGFRQIADNTIFFSTRRFRELAIPGYVHPQSGDIIVVGGDNLAGHEDSIYQIDYVDYDKQTASNIVSHKSFCYQLNCSTFTYSHEKLQTGNKVLDELDSSDILDDPESQNPTAINKEITTQDADLIDFDTNNPFANY